MSTDVLFQTLRNVRFLHDISPEYLAQIASVSSVWDFGPYELVFREGDAANRAYLVVSGNVSLEICAAAVGCKRILTIGPGELLGWSSLLGEKHFTATARTLAPTRVVQIDAQQLFDLCKQSTDLGFELILRTARALAKRLSATRMQLLDVYGSQFPVTGYAFEEDHA